MQFKIVNAGKSAKQTSIKGLLYGESGIGKTFLSATAPRPLVLLTEVNGQASIMHSNPDADLIHIESAAMLGQVLKDIDENAENWSDYDTIVIDSLTEVQRLIKDKITNQGRSPMRLQDWGTMADNMRALIRRIRGITTHNVVCICLLESQIEEDTGIRHIRPAFEGKKTSGEIAQYFNFVGFLHSAMVEVTQKDGSTKKQTERRLMVEGPSRVLCKPTYPLEGVIVNPNLTDLFNTIQNPPKRVQKGNKSQKTKVKPVNTER